MPNKLMNPTASLITCGLSPALAYAEKNDEELAIKKWKKTCFQKKSEILLIP